MRVAARVDETERGRLALAQPVTLQLDAIPDRQFTGKIEHIGTIATSDFSAGWPIPRNFDLEISIDPARPAPQARHDRADHRDRRPYSQCDRHSRAGVVPQIWPDSGLRLEWIGFQERAIRVERRSRDRILISSGLKPGELVALTEPSGKE